MSKRTPLTHNSNRTDTQRRETNKTNVVMCLCIPALGMHNILLRATKKKRIYGKKHTKQQKKEAEKIEKRYIQHTSSYIRERHAVFSIKKAERLVLVQCLYFFVVLFCFFLLVFFFIIVIIIIILHLQWILMCIIQQ